MSKTSSNLADAMTPIVLVVDDDPDDREITRRVLRKSRLTLDCLQADSGEAALALLKDSEHLPALTLMDLKMPGMSGIETLQRFRADTRLCKLPVVIVTNSSLESDRKAAMAAGADDFIPKAMDLGHFATEIGALLNRWVK